MREACIATENLRVTGINNNNVRYLIVGGYALALHGCPRYTKDIDIWIWLDRENAKNTLKTLHDFGFAELAITETDLLTPQCH